MNEAATTAGLGRAGTRARPRKAEKELSFSNGWWGMLVFVATEATLFGCLFGSYFYLRFHSVQWPPVGIEPKAPAVPLILAGVLAATAVPMRLASRAGRQGRAGAAWLFVLGALVVQAGFFAFQLHDFLADLDTFAPQDSAYASIYYTLLGADLFHVALGLLLSLWLLFRLAGGLTPYRLSGLQAVTLYWYAVGAITLLVAGVIVSASA